MIMTKEYNELIKFFDNPVIQKEIELTKINTEREQATKFLKDYLKYYIEQVDCSSINISWEKGKDFNEFNIYYSESFLK